MFNGTQPEDFDIFVCVCLFAVCCWTFEEQEGNSLPTTFSLFQGHCQSSLEIKSNDFAETCSSKMLFKSRRKNGIEVREKERGNKNY